MFEGLSYIHDRRASASAQELSASFGGTRMVRSPFLLGKHACWAEDGALDVHSVVVVSRGNGVIRTKYGC